MGNCVSQVGQREFLKNLQTTPGEGSTSDDPEAFQVFVKKRNKFIPGTLKVTDNEIVFIRSRCDTLTWPLHFLRRYGFTSAGIFFFESGRRCTSGAGLHTFQSHQAEAVFQLVQSRIQDNANMGTVIREALSQSVTGSIHSIHNLPPSYPGRIQPIQRYFSEGNSSHMGDTCAPSYRNYQPSYSRFSNRRQFVPPLTRRPRSIAGPANHTTVWPLPPPAYHSHSHRSCLDQPAFLGNVISEHVIHRQPSETDCCDHSYYHSYVNVLPQRRSATSSPQCLSPSLRKFSSSSQFTFGSTDKDLSFGSQRFNISVPPSHCCSGRYVTERPFFNRYVNQSRITGQSDEDTAAQLDYASLTMGVANECTPPSPRPLPTHTKNESLTAGATVPAVNYTRIDLDKTHAVEVAASTIDSRRHFKNAS